MSVNDKMTAVAGGIRTLTGKTAKLTLDGMKTDLATLKTYVTNALNAVKEKGVTVSSTAKLQNLASLIGSIETGGGSASELFGYQIASGTVTPTSDTYKPITVTTTIKPGKTSITGDVLMYFHDSTIGATGNTAKGLTYFSFHLQNAGCAAKGKEQLDYGAACYCSYTSGSKVHYVSPDQLGGISVNSSGYVQISLYAEDTKNGFHGGTRYRWLYIRRGLGE